MEYRHLAIGLLALSVLGCINAEGFLGTGVETVYKYFGDVRAGSNFPAEFASQFGIKADLKIQSVDGSKAIFQFSDVSYQVSTGQLSDQEHSNAIFIPAPPESAPLKEPFEVIYDGGKVKSVLTVDEPEWSLNIKKAVATIFQLDMPDLHYEKPNAFLTEEQTLYGICTVGYNVQPKGAGFVDVLKTQEYSKCKGFPTRYYTNGVYEECPYDVKDDSLLLGSTRYYKLFNDHGKVQVKEIFSQSAAAAVPFNGKADEQTILVRQNFTFVSANAITEAIEITPNHEIKELKYVIPAFYNEVGSFSDLTGGRNKETKEEVMEKVYKTLEDLVDYMEEIKVVNEPDKLNNKLTQRLTYYLGHLDTECLTHCFEKYINPQTYREENLRGAFLEVAAQVGSKASVLFIRDTVINQKVPVNVASEILRLVPFYVREPNKDLIHEYESLLKADLPEKVKKTAVLSLSTMVVLAYQKTHNVEEVNQYADLFYKSFKDATEYGYKLNYLTALSNLEEGHVLDYLIEVVKDEHYSHHLQYVALWGTKAGGMKFPTKVYDLYWSIFSNRNEHIEMRAAAMKLIMITEPTFDRFLSVFWFMQSEPSSQLYYYFYTGLMSVRDTNYPCFKKFASYAQRFARYAKNPVASYLFTGDFFSDYMDHKHSLGGNTHISLIGDSSTGAPNVFYYSQGGYMTGYHHEYFAVMVKLSGVAESLQNQLKKVDKEAVKMGDLMKIFSTLNIKTVQKEPFHMEVIFYTSGRAVETYFYDENNFMKVIEDVKGIGSSLQRDFKLRQHGLIFAAVHDYIQPTDIGLPAVWNLAIPYSYSVVGNFTHDTTGPRFTRKNSMEIRYGRYGGHSLSFYNPFAGMWQGAYRMHSYMFTIPIHNHMSIDFTQKHFKFAMTRDALADLNMAVAYHVRTQVFATDYANSNALQQSCPSCSPYVTVHKPGNANREFNVFSYDSIQTGLEYKLDVFDCEQFQSNLDLIPLIDYMFDENEINDHYSTVGEFLLGVRKMHTYFGFSPAVGSCGVMFRAVPSKAYPYTTLEGVVHMITDETKPSDKVSTFYPASKYTVRGSVTVKGDDAEKMYHTVDLNAFLENSPDHVNQHMSIKLTHTAPKDKDYKICMDFENKYPELPSDMFVQRKPEEEDVSSKFTWVWGYSVDGKCPTEGSGLKGTVISSVVPVDNEHGLVYPYSDCHEDVEKPEWKGKGHTPVTGACFKAALDSTTLRKFKGYVQYSNIDNSLIEIGSSIHELFDETLEIQEVSHDGESLNIDVPNSLENFHGKGKTGVVKYSVEFEKDDSTVDMVFEWNEPEHEYERYVMPYDESVIFGSSRFFYVPRLAYEIGYLSSCVVTPSSVLTLDNDTFHYHSSHCYTLASADCSEHPSYAVFTKKVEGPYDLALKFFTGGNYLEIVPNVEGHFDVNVNGHPVTGGLQNGYQYPEDEEFYDFKLWHKDGFVSMHSKISRVYVEYTGHSVSMTVPALYHGYACGLCGDYNRDKLFYERLGEVSKECPYGVLKGDYLGYRYTKRSEKCPEVTEELAKHVECVKYH